MTQREKVLATTLVGLVGFLVSAGVLFKFVLQPLKQVMARRDMAKRAMIEKQNEVTEEQAKVC